MYIPPLGLMRSVVPTPVPCFTMQVTSLGWGVGRGDRIGIGSSSITTGRDASMSDLLASRYWAAPMAHGISSYITQCRQLAYRSRAMAVLIPCPDGVPGPLVGRLPLKGCVSIKGFTWRIWYGYYIFVIHIYMYASFIKIFLLANFGLIEGIEDYFF